MPDTAAGLDHNYVLDSEPGTRLQPSCRNPATAWCGDGCSGLRYIPGIQAPREWRWKPGLPKCRQCRPSVILSASGQSACALLVHQIGGMPESRSGYHKKRALQQRPLRAFLCGARGIRKRVNPSPAGAFVRSGNGLRNSAGSRALVRLRVLPGPHMAPEPYRAFYTRCAGCGGLPLCGAAWPCFWPC